MQDITNQPEEARFTPKEKLSGVSNSTYCVVCGNCAINERNLVFHAFPKEGRTKVRVIKGDGYILQDRRQAWFDATLAKPTAKRISVCSAHFNKSDYILPGVHGNKKRQLKVTAVPTLDLPSPEVGLKRHREKRMWEAELQRDKARQILHQISRSQQRVITMNGKEVPLLLDQLTVNEMDPRPELEQSTATEEDTYHQPVLPVPVLEQLIVSDEVTNPQHASICDEPINNVSSHDTKLVTSPKMVSIGTQTYITGDVLPVTKPLTRDRGVNVTSGNLINNFTDTLDTDKKVKTFTGIPGLGFLLGIVTLLNMLKPDTNKGFLRTKDRVVLTYMKLKLNLPFSVLASLFHISASRAKSIYHDTLYGLETATRCALYWPSKAEVMKNIPICFRKALYSNVRVILDATEIMTTKTKCILCRCKAYSRYKCRHTIKFLVRVTPAGLISFVSKAYGGRASDKCIFNDSGLINKLEPHIDSVMVDKGVLIKDICAKHNIKLIHPEFLRKPYRRFSRPQSKTNFNVATCRVHVERAIGRVKNFKILKDGIPWNQAGYAGVIFRVISATVNLSNPILAMNKFVSTSDSESMVHDTDMEFSGSSNKACKEVVVDDILTDDSDYGWDDIDDFDEL